VRGSWIGRPHLEGAKRLNRAPVAVRPAETCSSQQRGLAADEPGMHAVAVVFDFVQPTIAGWRLVYQARELRLDPLGRSKCRSHGSNWSISSVPLVGAVQAQPHRPTPSKKHVAS